MRIHFFIAMPTLCFLLLAKTDDKHIPWLYAKITFFYQRAV